MKNPLKKLTNKFNLAATGGVLLSALALLLPHLQPASAFMMEEEPMMSSSISTMNTINTMNAINAANLAAHASRTAGSAVGPTISVDPHLALLVMLGAGAATGIGIAVHHMRKKYKFGKTKLSDVFNGWTVGMGATGSLFGALSGLFALLVMSGGNMSAAPDAGAIIATLGTGIAVGGPLTAYLVK